MKKFFALLCVAAALTIAVGCGKSAPPAPAAAPSATGDKMEEHKMEAPAGEAAAPAEEPAK